MRPKVPTLRLLSVWVIALAVPLQTCSSNPTPVHPEVTPDLIVQQNALDAFDTFLRADDKPALRAFRADIAGAHSREELVAAWRGNPSLVSKGADFLVVHVFDKASHEARWPKDQPLTALEPAFANGTRLAVDEYLQKGGP